MKINLEVVHKITPQKMYIMALGNGNRPSMLSSRKSLIFKKPNVVDF